MFGDTTSLIQNEDTPFIPRSPYAISKVRLNDLKSILFFNNLNSYLHIIL